MKIIINDGKEVIMTSREEFNEFLIMMEDEGCVAILLKIKGYGSPDTHPTSLIIQHLEEELRKLKSS